MSTRALSFVSIAVILLIQSRLLAQQPTAGSVASTPQTAAPATVGWQNGFFIQNANGDYRLVLGVLIQTDGRFSTDDGTPFTNTFSPRKLRPTFQGRIARHFDFRLTPEFGNGIATVVDAYMDVRISPAFRVRTGKDKTPVGLEILQSDATLAFPERSLASSLLPNRDIGVQAQGDLARSKVSYAGGVFNGIVDGSNSTLDLDANNAKDVAGRVVYQPFRASGTPAPVLNNLGLHLGGSFGSQAGPLLPSFRTSAGQVFFSYAGTTADGERTRVTPAAFYYFKRAGLFVEYVRVTQEVAKANTRHTVTNTGWDLTGIVNLTGEVASSGIVAPQRPFDPTTGHWGALQLAARYSELNVDGDAFSQGLASATSSQRARQATIGLNWYPVQYVKYYLTYERTTFSGGTVSRPPENAVILRVQLAF